MPLYEGDVSEYTSQLDSEAARLLVDIDPPDPDTGARRVVVTDDADGKTVGTLGRPTGALGRLTAEWDQRRPVLSGLRTIQADSEAGAEVGKQLFSVLFSRGLSRCWAKAVDRARMAGGLELVIRSDEILVHGLPWELLFDPVVISGHLILRDRWSVVRQRQTANGWPDQAAVVGSKLSILAMTAGVVGGISLDNDPNIIRSAFPEAQTDVVQATTESVTLRALMAEPRHLVHILATGERSPEAQRLLVGGPNGTEAISGQTLVGALTEAGRPPGLVVLAACETDMLAAELAASVPAVIGMRGFISDDGCLAFTRGLYGALASGAPIAQAVSAGRAQQLSFSQSLGNEWAAPVLFLNGAGLLVASARSGGRQVAFLAAPEAAASDTFLLDMKRLNLDALRQQWHPEKSKVMPAFVHDQIAALEGEVDRLSQSGLGQ